MYGFYRDLSGPCVKAYSFEGGGGCRAFVRHTLNRKPKNIHWTYILVRLLCAESPKVLDLVGCWV